MDYKCIHNIDEKDNEVTDSPRASRRLHRFKSSSLLLKIPFDVQPRISQVRIASLTNGRPAINPNQVFPIACNTDDELLVLQGRIKL